MGVLVESLKIFAEIIHVHHGHEDGHEDCEGAWRTAKQRSKLSKAWIGIGAVKQSPGMTRIDFELNWGGLGGLGALSALSRHMAVA